MFPKSLVSNAIHQDVDQAEIIKCKYSNDHLHNVLNIAFICVFTADGRFVKKMKTSEIFAVTFNKASVC